MSLQFIIGGTGSDKTETIQDKNRVGGQRQTDGHPADPDREQAAF